MNIIPVTELDSAELDVYARLNEVQLLHFYEPNGGIFIAESRKVIDRALEAGCEPVSVLTEPRHLENELLTRCGDVPVYVAEPKVMTKLTGYALTGGILCAMHRPKMPSLAQLCAHARRIAVLEDVVNPTNVGAIFRCAAALNMDAVILTAASTDPLYRRAIRVSMGTVFQIPWTILAPDRSISSLHEYGFQTVAMALRDDSVTLEDPRLAAAPRLAIVLGTEGDGLSAQTLADCDYTVRIPMSHNVDSLNVAAASAVAFYVLGK